MPRLIDADAAVELLRNLGSRDYRREKGTIMDAMKMLSYDEYTPTIDPESLRPHGRWIRCNGKSNLWYCSNCGEIINYNPTRRTYNIEKRLVHEVHKWCRGCGAKKDEEEEDA